MPTAGPTRLDLESLWTDLGRSAETAHTSIWHMVQLPGVEAFLAKRLHSLLVSKAKDRTQQISRCIIELSSEGTEERESAQKQLFANLDHAEGAILQAAKKGASGEASRCLKILIAQVFERRQSPKRIQVDRALAVLEYLGTATAKNVLKGIASGSSDHWLTEEANAALQRIR